MPRIAIARWGGVAREYVERYHERLREAGLEPVDLSGEGASLAGCDGLVLTGGGDVDPALYGETPWPQTEGVSGERDAFEAGLLREALDGDLPVLAICRGAQLLNVCLGGSLQQHIESGAHRALAEPPHDSRWHEVSLGAGTRLRQILGADRLRVNSRHHQAVTPAGLAPGLRIAAMSDDGVVEAMEGSAQRWLCGVQWHPEREENEQPGFADTSRRLFRAFAEAMRG
jgi:putative glutamine amidotransferase